MRQICFARCRVRCSLSWKSVFVLLRKTLSEPSGENAMLSACDRFSPLLCISICSLTTLNFCIPYCFVFLDGEQHYLVSRPFTDSNSFALQGWQLDHSCLRRIKRIYRTHVKSSSKECIYHANWKKHCTGRYRQHCCL